jgi:hypothetical protein
MEECTLGRPLAAGSPAPDFDLPGVPSPVSTRMFAGAPRVIEFHRGTW